MRMLRYPDYHHRTPAPGTTPGWRIVDAPHTKEGAMPLPIRGPSWGSPEQAVEVAIRRGAKRPEFLREYAVNLWRDCAALGVRADTAWAQADVETGHRTTGIGFQSDRWLNEGNPAGIGVVDNLPDGTPVHTFTPETAARVHATHLAGYAGIAPPAEWVELDYRWEAMLRAGYYGVATTTDDLSGRWATGKDYGQTIEARWRLYGFSEPTATTPPADGGGGTTMAITFGRVPMYGYQKRILSNSEAVEGRGWNNLGKRNPKFIALHRMWGTLWGTDGYFRNPAVASLTDFGLGVEPVDGAKNAGVIIQWNDPLGYRSGWASGPVSKPYGDGLCIVNKYGVNAVNRDGISMEISGKDEPMDAVSWRELVHFCAWWIDWMKIPYTALPRNPHTGCNVLIWHNEFTDGTGKQCPFPWVRNNTGRLYKDIQAFLKPYQEGAATPKPEPQPEPEPEPETPPQPQYADPMPVEALVLADPNNRDAVEAIRTLEGAEFVYVADRVRAVKDTPRLQHAGSGAPSIGPDIRKGEEFDVDWLVKNHAGEWFYITGWWTRVRQADTERIGDAVSQGTP